MSVSLEKIDMLMERANISYKEAKEALEKYDGDMVEALIYLEDAHKTGPKPSSANSNQRQYRHQRRQYSQRPQNDFFEDMKKFFDKMHKTSFVIGKKNKKVLDIPLTVAAIIILLTLPVSLILLVLPYVFGYKIVILDPKGSKVKVEDAFQFNEETVVEKEPEDRRS
ncbi:DUF4342 domain-containing protein [Fusibacter ferrireducens]|uniref:DUF4342 domain-containing protein n=1 Tax=Fusibacter ferrireducens TaxID=2785058 RepID=A0ABR9ZY09_9FIRM|nr:DUF4342 domain-containing protein [Fusibacter ferrireducens]MBF4695339.1 DUF4342 domain-containing protein [Fusibacter ferrireducens]